jgi:hypothetical protein
MLTAGTPKPLNVMHLLFNLLRSKGLYMFRALLAHPQEALNKRILVYYMCVLSVGCTKTSDKTRTNIPSSACVAPPEYEQVILKTCRGP